LKTSLKAIEIAKNNRDVYAAVALHPIHVNPSTSLRVNSEQGRTIKDEEFQEEQFLKLAKSKEVVAIGETGLDYYYDQSTKSLQKEIFQKFLKIAQRVSKPVILHSREAAEDILPIIMAERPEIRGVMHCFQENWQFAKIILDMGLYISFTGLITFTKNQATFEVIREAPLERILIETDCPYMTPAFVETSAGKPEPMRGKRNEPAYVVEVAKKIAEIKKIPLGKVAEQTSQNAIELFKLDIK